MIFLRYDIVVDATDNAPSRYMISDCCVVLGKVNRPSFDDLEKALTLNAFRRTSC